MRDRQADFRMAEGYGIVSNIGLFLPQFLISRACGQEVRHGILNLTIFEGG